MALHTLRENLHLNYAEGFSEWTRRAALSKSGVETILLMSQSPNLLMGEK